MNSKYFALTFAAACLFSTGAIATPCSDLTGLKLENAEIRYAEDIAAGSTRRMGARELKDLPGFCRVVASTGADRHSNIVVEIWLPAEQGWNGKFLGTGNGAFAGAIRYDQLIGGLKHGYAVANTDMGTFPAAMIGGAGYAAGTGHPDAIADWGWRATHEMTVLGRALVDRFYGRKPLKAYFSGCSTGGHQALTEAQRFPDDYDAILAGAPGHNRTHLHLMFLQTFMDAHQSPASFVPLEKIHLVTDALLKTCVGKDGGAPGDKYLTDPTACRWSPRALLCKQGNDPASCLTAAQVTTFEKVYRGGANNRTGHLFYPGWPKGSEAIFGHMFGVPDGKAGAADTLVAWTFGPDFDASTFDFDKNIDRHDALWGPTINAMSPDLSAFASHGGKLILFHGWADAVVSPLDTIEYFDRVQAANANNQSFVRLFMAPGVGHCAAGPGGADDFGQNNDPRPGHNPESDILDALDAWATQGHAPGKIVAAKYDADAKKISTRPICAYPSRARYNGGDVTDAKNFECVAGPSATFERPSSEYLH